MKLVNIVYNASVGQYLGDHVKKHKFPEYLSKALEAFSHQMEVLSVPKLLAAFAKQLDRSSTICRLSAYRLETWQSSFSDSAAHGLKGSTS